MQSWLAARAAFEAWNPEAPRRAKRFQKDRALEESPHFSTGPYPENFDVVGRASSNVVRRHDAFEPLTEVCCLNHLPDKLFFERSALPLGYYRVALPQLYPRQFTPQALCVSSWPLEGPSLFAFAPLHSPESTDQFDLARKKASRYRSKAGVSLDLRSPSLIPAGPLRERGLREEEIHQ